MSITFANPNNPERHKVIAELNDQFRREGVMAGILGEVVLDSTLLHLPPHIIEYFLEIVKEDGGRTPSHVKDRSSGYWEWEDYRELDEYGDPLRGMMSWHIRYTGIPEIGINDPDPSDPMRSWRILTIQHDC